MLRWMDPVATAAQTDEPRQKPAQHTGAAPLHLIQRMEASKTRNPRPLSAKEKAALALAITWVAGFVDAVGYLVLSHIYTANMSGNTVSVGLHLALLDWGQVARKGWPVLMFVAGLMFCSLIHESGKRAGVLATSSITFALEAAMLAAFIPLSAASLHGGQLRVQSASLFYLIVALPALAMGLQNATISHVGALSLRTTHVTGSLTTLAEALAVYLFWLYDRTRGRFRRRIGLALRLTPRQKSAQALALMTGSWIAFVTGAACGAFLNAKWQTACLLPPICLLLILALVDVFRPIAAAWAKHVE